jgi:chromosome segregation ATPase
MTERKGEGMGIEYEKLSKEDRERISGEERLKITLSMPIWLKMQIYKESKDKGIPIWEYLARIIEENKRLKEELKRGSGGYDDLVKKNEELRKKNEELIKKNEELIKTIVEVEKERRRLKREKEEVEKKYAIAVEIVRTLRGFCGRCFDDAIAYYKKQRQDYPEEIADLFR